MLLLSSEIEASEASAARFPARRAAGRRGFDINNNIKGTGVPAAATPDIPGRS
jgi:hypothetical protein